MKIKKNILILAIVLGVILLTGFVFISTGLVSLKNMGYNYKSHLYKGTLCDYRPSEINCDVFQNIKMDIKWNEAYMSSTMNEIGEYERHIGFDSYFGSGAWKTEHYYGKYYDKDLDKKCIWNAVQTFSAVPSESLLNGLVWRNKKGLAIGEKTSEDGIMIVSLINNDNCYDDIKGVEYRSETQSN